MPALLKRQLAAPPMSQRRMELGPDAFDWLRVGALQEMWPTNRIGGPDLVGVE
jgi:hypothetical protein